MLESFMSSVWLMLRLMPEREEPYDPTVSMALIALRGLVVVALITELGAIIRQGMDGITRMACKISVNTTKIHAIEACSVILTAVIMLFSVPGALRIAEKWIMKILDLKDE